MKTFAALLLCALALSSSSAQTQAEKARAELEKRYGPAAAGTPAAKPAPPPAPVAADFRVVTNQLYNIQRSLLWKPFDGEVLKVLTNGVILQHIIVTSIYERPQVNYAQSIGGAYSGMQQTGRLISQTREPGKVFFVRNYPTRPPLTTGKELRGKALLVGVYNYNADILELWDYGTAPAAK